MTVTYSEVATRLRLDAAFADARHEDLARLLTHVQFQKYGKGEKVVSAGEPAENLYLIVSGEAQLQGAATARTAVNDRFGEEAGVDTPKYLFDAIANSALEVAVIPRSALTRLYRNAPTVKDRLYVALLGRSASAHTAVPSIQTPPAVSHIKTTEFLGWMTTLAIPAALLVLGPHDALPWSSVVFLAILSATVLMWAFQLVDEFIPGLFALFAILITGLAPPSIALSGFTSEGFFIAMSVLGLGTVIVASGLSYRFLLFLLNKLPNRPVFHDLGLVVSGTLLTPMVPSINNRVTLMHSFMTDMIETLGHKPGSRAATRLAIAVFTGVTVLSAVFISSKSPNFIIYGMLPPQEQDRFQFTYWVLAAALAGGVMLLAYFLASLWVYRHEKQAALSKEQLAAQLQILGPMKNREWAALVGIATFLFGVITASLHHMQPPWLGMAILYALLLFGFLRKDEFKEKVEWPLLVYLASIIGIVATFNHLGLDHWLSGHFGVLRTYLGSNLALFILVLFAIMFLVRLVIPISASIVIFATALMPLSESTGISAWVIGFIVLSLGEFWLFPYQCSYYLHMRSLNQGKSLYDEGQFLRFNVLMNVFRVVALLASIPYWKSIGIL